jgi:hypothetical protein
LIKHKTARSLRLSAFAALFFSVIAVGCTDSEANETERIMAELETQMQVAEQEVAEAVQEYRENSGDMKDDVRRRIEDARRELDRARRKLQELHQAGRDSYSEHESDDRYGDKDRDDRDSERIRIRVNGDTVVDLDTNGHDSEGSYDYDYDYDYDVDIDIDEEEIEAIVERLGESLERMGEAISKGADVESVDSDDLRDLFLKEIAGMKRVNINSDREGAFGFTVTTVEAEYRGQRTELELTVVDLGSLGGLAQEGLDMIDAEIDERTEDGYTRTMTVNGYPAKIEFERKRSKDELSVAIFVGERFVVAMEAVGTDLTEELIDDVFDDFDLDDLEDLD